ncbi:hypothetical protein ABW21_db0200599 [Orbilia brochopaga]|nr:hypothetical protein ABW21_db0200599 [Drechslerella brochopaga]
MIYMQYGTLRSARDAIRDAFSQNQQQPITFDDASLGDAAQLELVVKSKSFEHRQLKLQYDSEKHQIRVTMPNSAYKVAVGWMERVKIEWETLLPKGYDDHFVTRSSPRFECFVGEHWDAEKEPDYCFGPCLAKFPSMVIEVGNSDSDEKLMQDKDFWLQGSGGAVKVVILIHLKFKPIGAFVEIWRKDECVEQYWLFPQIESEEDPFLLVSEIFGDIDVPANMDPETKLPLSLSALKNNIEKEYGWLALPIDDAEYD